MHIKRMLFEINCQNILGENVLWHAQEQSLYWTDIQGKSLYKCAMTDQVIDLLSNDEIEQHVAKDKSDYFQQVLQVFDLPFRLGSFAFTHDKHILLAGFENGLAAYNYSTRQLNWLSKEQVASEHLRFNDGKCDPKGRYWLGSMVESKDVKKLKTQDRGGLFVFWFDKGSLQSKTILSDIHISNGLCFSDDARFMYHTDSSSHKVYQYTLGENAEIQSRKLFAKFDKNTYPDGACTDKYDNVWMALWGAACIVCFDKKGNEVLRHPLPVTQASCVCIGGPNMNWLFVTSANLNLSDKKRAEQPRAGNVFVYELSDALGINEPVVAQTTHLS